MPIPWFDAYGNLPVALLEGGAHQRSCVQCTLEEVRQRFVENFPESATRARIWDGWIRHRVELAALGLEFTTLVNGSFATGKEDPGDVDICLLLNGEILDGLAPDQREALRPLVAGRATRATHMCDAYPVPVYPFTHPHFTLTVSWLSYWTRLFGHDYSGRQKGFLLIAEQGVE